MPKPDGDDRAEKGKHPIRIHYFEDFLGEELRLGWEGPGLKRTEIPMDQFSH
ncbi:MAG: hypothetical protein HC880_08650 [Bacteroidia bacterium]|nr:hypothetical protein [Bacteroidia bacterium]